VRILTKLAQAGSLPTVAQPAEGVVYAGKIEREHAALDWRKPADILDRAVRAFDPAPGAFTYLGTDLVKVWSAEIAPGSQAPPGTILRVGTTTVDVACGKGSLRLLSVQPAGGKRMSAAAFAAGRKISPGARFSDADS